MGVGSVFRVAAPETVRVHDLVRLADPAELAGDAPDWVSEALAQAPWAVVRRDVAPDGHIAVGVRGQTRAQRWGAVARTGNVSEVVTPEELVVRVGCVPPRMPAAQALLELRARLRTLPVQWGPTGSAGFELATGLATLRPASDLDIVVHAQPHRDLPAQWDLLVQLGAAFRNLPARVDAQLALDVGAVALEELLSGAGEVLVKTPSGPALMPVAPMLMTSRIGTR